jgi:hypothetical protein
MTGVRNKRNRGNRGEEVAVAVAAAVLSLLTRSEAKLIRVGEHQ